jgi:hypothetical protein
MMKDRIIITDSHPPGRYLLDVKRAVERIAGGRVAGVCKICFCEFRIPNDFAEWKSFLRSMIRHPLEHKPTKATKQKLRKELEILESLFEESDESALLEIISHHLKDLTSEGILVRSQDDS